MWGKTESMFYRGQDRVFRTFSELKQFVNGRGALLLLCIVVMWLTVLRWATVIRAGPVCWGSWCHKCDDTQTCHYPGNAQHTHHTCHPGLTVGHMMSHPPGARRDRDRPPDGGLWPHGERRLRCPDADAISVPAIWTRHCHSDSESETGDAAIIITPGPGHHGSGRLCLISTRGWNERSKGV